MIIVGLGVIAWFVGDMAGGPEKIIAAAAEAGKFDFWPKGGTKEWLAFITAFLPLAIGSIPPQDIFPRVTFPKNERTPVPRSLPRGDVYFTFPFVPLLLLLPGLLIDSSL